MGISVIIPALNEEACIAATVRAVREQVPVEMIVVDGGSSDGTLRAAKEADQVLSGPRGRARQMNFGVQHARGDILLFLHADCVPEPGALREAEYWLRRRSVVAGCFQLVAQADGLIYRLIDICATARVRLTGIAYGDQGLFLRRDTFQACGGFPDLRFMEDLVMCRQLRRLGRVVVARRRVFVSPRRWQRVGVVRQTLRNWSLTALAAAGVSPERLARFYPVVR